MPKTLNFPVPGFVGSPTWINQWYVGNSEGTSARFNESGQLSVEKIHKHTSHAMLNAVQADLKTLGKGRGVTIDSERAYSVHINVEKSRKLKVQLAIHAFDRSGLQTSRKLLENGERALYVPEKDQTSLVISVRMAGSGSFTIRSLEFSPNTVVSTDTPGLHVLERIETVRDTPVHTETTSDIYALMPIRQALHTQVPLSALMTRQQAKTLVAPLINNRHMLDAKVLVEQFNLYKSLSTKQLRVLFWHGRKSGYVFHALLCIDEIFARSKNEKDQFVAAKLRSEYEFHRDPWLQLPQMQSSDSYDRNGPVLHMVGKAMPEKQTGYTVRTKYTVDALRRAGIGSVVAVQVAGNHEDGVTETTEQDVDGTPTVMFGGPPARDTLKGAWMRRNAEELLKLVERVRPRVIHAHSDFTNGVLATHVGEATGVPVVYESRGFWEETWISRISKAQGWEDLEQIVKMYGVPDLYSLRRNSERRVRERADRIVTLADTMKNFIISESPGGGVDPDHVYLARNAVDGGDFPIQINETGLRASLGISPECVVVGYISSMVEYEGIETLMDGFKKLSSERENVHLLLVGDGMHLNSLKRYAQSSGIENITFTGRISHHEVVNYYHAIDIFVVPRRKSRVTDLVTPLKPFEAFSTGRAVVLSNVSALSEIAEDSSGAALTFPADDSGALARILLDLTDSPEIRTAMGTLGAEWVRTERSWDSNVPVYTAVYEDVQR